MSDMTMEEIDEARRMLGFENHVNDATIIAVAENTFLHRRIQLRFAIRRLFKKETEPILFRQANGTLHGNRVTRDLPVCRTTEGHTVSCWKIPFWKRVRLLRTGNVWLVVKGTTHPPLWIDTEVIWR